MGDKGHCHPQLVYFQDEINGPPPGKKKKNKMTSREGLPGALIGMRHGHIKRTSRHAIK